MIKQPGINSRLFDLLSAKQKHRYIVYIGTGRAGHQQASAFLQGVVSVVFLQHPVNPDPLLPQLSGGFPIYYAACRVGRAVGTV